MLTILLIQFIAQFLNSIFLISFVLLNRFISCHVKLNAFTVESPNVNKLSTRCDLLACRSTFSSNNLNHFLPDFISLPHHRGGFLAQSSLNVASVH